MLTLTLAAAVLAAPVPVFVTIEATEGRFVDPEAEKAQEGARDSAKDLTKKLEKKEALRLVESPDEAAVVITVVGRGFTPTGATVTRAQWNSVKTTEETIRTVYAILTVGDYSLDLFGQNDGRMIGAWGTAAGKLADKIEDWVEANAEQLQAP